MNTTAQQLLTITTGITLLFCCLTIHAQTVENNMVENDQLTMRVSTGKSERVAAFYTGRGFNQESINAITRTCFVSVRLKNKKYETLWLKPDDWMFFDSQGDMIKRIMRKDWKVTWKKTGLKQAQQSTFDWTQLPEERDLRPDEHVGGNLIIPWQEEPFGVVASFKTGKDQSGEPVVLSFNNLICATN